MFSKLVYEQVGIAIALVYELRPTFRLDDVQTLVKYKK